METTTILSVLDLSSALFCPSSPVSFSRNGCASAYLSFILFNFILLANHPESGLFRYSIPALDYTLFHLPFCYTLGPRNHPPPKKKRKENKLRSRLFYLWLGL